MDYTKEEFIKDWVHLLACINFKDTALDSKAIDFMLYGPAKICEALELAQANK